jgi:glycosyltransferase involved in cell wall biosynthesis
VVWLIQKVLSVHVVYHEHDTPDLGAVQSLFMNKVFNYRARLARNAELCVVPQNARLLQLVKTTNRTSPAFCVWNCPRLNEIQNSVLSVNRELVIYYHGSITKARLPENLIVAACRFKGAIRLKVAGYEPLGSIGYLRQLTSLAVRNGVPELIEPHGTIPLRRDLMHSASTAHVGLSLMPNKHEDINLQHMVGASNKPFDCMACGLPLLVTDVPEWVSTFVEPGYARACDPDDLDSIEAELRWYLDHPDARREMSRKCREKIRQDWNYETMFAAVLAKMENG